MDADNLIKETGKLLGIELKLDGQRRCAVKEKISKKEYILEVPEKNGQIYIYSRVGTIPDSVNYKRYFLGLLEMNLFGIQTRNSTIGIDSMTRQIILHASFPLDLMTPKLIGNLIKNFIKTLEKVGEKVRDLQQKCIATGDEMEITLPPKKQRTLNVMKV